SGLSVSWPVVKVSTSVVVVGVALLGLLLPVAALVLVFNGALLEVDCATAYDDSTAMAARTEEARPNFMTINCNYATNRCGEECRCRCKGVNNRGMARYIAGVAGQISLATLAKHNTPTFHKFCFAPFRSSSECRHPAR